MQHTNYEAAVALRHELHAHPELSNEEVWTKQRIFDFMRSHTKRIQFHDRGTWFYGVYREPAKKAGIAKPRDTLMFRADFDALPMDEAIQLPWASKIAGKAHKCGHDGHSATLAAFAMEVDQHGADSDVVFLWQPAEEVGNGAVQCLPVLDAEHVSRVYGYHNMAGFPYKCIVLRDGVIQCASVGMIVKFTGTPAHASQPENGKNPSMAIATLIQRIPELTKDAKDLLLCTVVQVNIGNRQFGMSAHYGELLVTIRATFEKELEELKEGLAQLSQAEAARAGLTCAFEYSDAFPETRNTEACVDHVRAVAKAQGRHVHELAAPLRPSEDFGHYGKLRPSCYFFIGNGEAYPPIHTPSYDFRDEVIEVGVCMFKGLAGVRDTPLASL
ncbi:putative N-acyl-L-amino acid amidohydrolase [Leptomonas seymouri]|uniref:Putative N-acyl-L-amino acid amidohydrolase n=1 Tax=Leptomonas seymouri TaxID=5684 RepID=A0A0N0P327_LEPSE|nr:putative N-acyl-L-amino acid amidohydrolase [Leptomonas seymouri]|eukprot:KPI83646.1 putative N-acyl-L-amino acid amidohydrolase [Leptomonas seymouri]